MLEKASTGYLYSFNTAFGLLSLACVGLGAFLVNRDDTVFTGTFLGISCFFAIMYGIGLAYTRLGGRNLWMVYATLMILATCFLIGSAIAYGGFTGSTLDKVRDMDSTHGGDLYHRSYAFMRDNAKAMTIVTAIFSGLHALALAAGAYLRGDEILPSKGLSLPSGIGMSGVGSRPAASASSYGSPYDRIGANPAASSATGAGAAGGAGAGNPSASSATANHPHRAHARKDDVVYV
jgi:hypothetical protein